MDISDQYMDEEQNIYEQNYNYEDANINNHGNYMNNNKLKKDNDAKINKLYNLLLLYDSISLFNLKNDFEKSDIRTNNIINLLIFIFSGYNIKIKETPNMNNLFQNKNDLQNSINKINLILKFLNSKFLLKSNISSEEYFLLTIYFLDFFDFFKDIIDFLRNRQNESVISFNNIYISLDESNNYYQNKNEFNCNDNLEKIEKEKSNSVLESYNKLHFIISNIKKQLDNLINQIFKLNEIKINQSLGKYKLEELLLFCDEQLFNNYANNILYSNRNNFLNRYLLNIIEAIKLYPDLYDILVKESKNYNINNDLINNGHILSKESNKVDKTKLNIIQRLIDLKYNLKNFNLKNFETFFKNLQTKIDYNISDIKNKNIQKINNDEFTNMLNQVLMQLNNYINQNIIDLNNIIQSNVDIDYILKEIENAQKMFLSENKDIWETYSQYLFSIKEYVEIFYKKNIQNIKQIIKNKEGAINKDYQILNKEK